MEIAGVVLVVWLTVTLLGTIAGIIKPGLFNQESRAKVFAGGSILSFGIVCAFIFVANKNSDSSSREIQTIAGESELPASSPKDLNHIMSYHQMCESFAPYLKMSKSSVISGDEIYLGQTADESVTLEIIFGEEDNITQSILLLNVLDVDFNTMIRNMELMSTFVKDTTSLNWDGRSEWLESAIEFSKSTRKVDTIFVGNICLRVYHSDVLGLLALTATVRMPPGEQS